MPRAASPSCRPESSSARRPGRWPRFSLGRSMARALLPAARAISWRSTRSPAKFADGTTDAKRLQEALVALSRRAHPKGGTYAQRVHFHLGPGVVTAIGYGLGQDHNLGGTARPGGPAKWRCSRALPGPAGCGWRCTGPATPHPEGLTRSLRRSGFPCVPTRPGCRVSLPPDREAAQAQARHRRREAPDPSEDPRHLPNRRQVPQAPDRREGYEASRARFLAAAPAPS